MSQTLPLLDRPPVTLEAAIATDVNIIQETAYVPATLALYQQLWDARGTICALTAHHLRFVREDDCTVAQPREWKRGQFNVCIPIDINSASGCKRVIMRCPMPHKLAEASYPGTVDEKLSCEVGSYVWFQQNCPDIRIPHLYGFGFSDRRQFMHEQGQPIYVRVARMVRRCFQGLFGHPRISYYTRTTFHHRLPTAYMLLEFIGPDVGSKLSDTWGELRQAPAHRHRLFSGLSRLMISLARIPQPRIGSFRFHDDGTITLTNRPLSCTMMILENNGTRRIIQKGETYLCTEAFVSDMLTAHDNAFLDNANVTYDADDCRDHMAARTSLRALSHHYIKRSERGGPFFLQFTDLHASNIFVDEEWNITCLIDLEWICSQPVEMLSVPYWLTGYAIDEFCDDRFHEFNTMRKEFSSVFRDEEMNMGFGHQSLVPLMDEMWETGGIWFWHCISSVNAMIYLVQDHILPGFAVSPSSSRETLSNLWRKHSEKIVEKKVEDQNRYQEDLRRLFASSVKEWPT